MNGKLNFKFGAEKLSSDCEPANACVGRLAPSPTGALHLGNARSFLLAWLSVRQQGGKLILRIEDIDSPRVKPWAVESTISDLRWLGLDWDYGPGGADSETGSIHWQQSSRLERYHEVLSRLIEDGKVYRCSCTRSEVIEAAASAPHELKWQPLEGAIYPGTCRPSIFPTQCSAVAGANEYAFRWAFDDRTVEWTDRLLGHQRANPFFQLGDFVLARGNWNPAYQLAVVVDDFDMGVTEVVRGDDLVYSTYRQIAILDHLGWERPSYCHVPLIVGPDGRRLAKRHGDTRLSQLREQGVSPEAVLGYLAASLKLIEEPQKMSLMELLTLFQWDRIPLQPTVFELDRELAQMLSMN